MAAIRTPILNPVKPPIHTSPKFAVTTGTTVPALKLTATKLNKSFKSPVTVNISRPVAPGKAGTASVTVNHKKYTVKIAKFEGASEIAAALKKAIEKDSGKKLQVYLPRFNGAPSPNLPVGVSQAFITIYEKGFTTPEAPPPTPVVNPMFQPK